MKILICDEDINYAQKFKTQIVNIAAKYKVDAQIDIVESGSKMLFHKDDKYFNVDLIYIDYHMTGINGLDTAHKLRASGFTADIIINAIDDTHVHEGYDVEAMHYFIKGKTSEEKLEEVFLKAVERCQRRKKDIMTFGRRGEQINVPIDNILYFEVQGQIVTVHYYKGSSVETFKFYSTLQNICKPLVGKGFWKNHKSYVISKKYIYKMTAGQVEMENGDVLPIGREYKKNAGCDI